MPRLALAFFLAVLWATPGMAADFTNRIIASLEGQGYTIVERGFTFLGRLRVVAENADYHRELVFNSGTGEILRDYAIPMAVYLANQQRDSRDSSSNNDQPAVAVTAVSPQSTAETGGQAPPDWDIIIPEPVLP